MRFLRTTTPILAVLALAAAAVAWRPAPAQAATIESSTSSNWAGYAVSPADPSTSFTSASGSWVQPTADCSSSSPGYSAFWVGLGGLADESQALEQIGTEADCTAGGAAVYSAWYELVPAAPVRLKLKIAAGDTLSARVAVTGQTVSLHISNTTRGTVFTKKLRMASPDVSSAEWIAEAPSACNGYGGCRPLPLTNFGTVTFTGATATAGGHTGTISDPAWPATAIALQADGGGFYHGRFAGLAAAADATPAALSSDGASFAITWQQATGGPDPQQQPDPFSE